MRKHGETRLVISAVPGGGKTSFVKHVASEWVKHPRVDPGISTIFRGETTEKYSNNGWLIPSCFKKPKAVKDNSAEVGLPQTIKEYHVVLPIILRLIKHRSTLLTIIHEQIGRFSILNALALFNYLKGNEQTVLMILDGYDELKTYDIINEILSKDTFPMMTVICTTRPHGVTLIRQLGSRAIEQELRLCGFNDQQIQEYISRFFALLEEPKSKGNSLFEALNTERKELLKMAKVPIQLQIMCIVWNRNEDLGTHIVDLYCKFAACLIFHNKNKYKTNKQVSGEDSANTEYTEVQKKVAEIAYSWNKEGVLENVFFYEKLAKKYPTSIKSILQYGFLVKYHPFVLLEKSYWSFSHLTVQEYFVAYHLSQDINKETVSHFQSMCRNVTRLEHLVMVFRFLCGINPTQANQVLTGVIRRVEGEEECQRLLNFLLDLLPYYRDQKGVDLPLPR